MTDRALLNSQYSLAVEVQLDAKYDGVGLIALPELGDEDNEPELRLCPRVVSRATLPGEPVGASQPL